MELLSKSVLGNIDILMFSETKTDILFSKKSICHSGFAAPFRLERKNNCEGILVYVRDQTPSKLLNI